MLVTRRPTFLPRARTTLIKTICVDFGMKPRVPTETLEHNQMINASVPTGSSEH